MAAPLERLIESVGVQLPAHVAVRTLGISLALLILAACSSVDDVAGPTNTPYSASGLIVPMCQEGCIDVDPYPDSAGIFIGASSPEQCTVGTDSDLDSLTDFCEKNLAQGFAPELQYWSADEMGREPKWVARWLNDSTVRIGYLLSYYRDAGSSAGVCTVPPIGPWYPTESCFGHNGDPEALFLDVRYNLTSSHWVLWRAEYSAHGLWNVYTSGSDGVARVEYSGKRGGYPRAWVSQGKHANYKSRSACNNGGSFDSDTCVDVDVTSRVLTSTIYNLGSREMHTAGQDCWASENTSYQYYGSGRLECYWTASLFRGWIPGTVGGRSAEHHYSGILDQQGF